MIQIICECKKLVEVVDRRVSLHYSRGDGMACPRSGTRYVPQRRTLSADGSGSDIEVLHAGPVSHGDHSHNMVLLAAKGEYTPEEVASVAIEAIEQHQAPGQTKSSETIN